MSNIHGCTSDTLERLVVVHHILMREGELRNVGRDAGLPQVGGGVEGGPTRVHHVQRQVEDGALGRRHQQVLARDTLFRHRVPGYTQKTKGKWFSFTGCRQCCGSGMFIPDPGS